MEKREEFKRILRELGQDSGQKQMANEKGRSSYHRRFEDLYGQPNTEGEFRHFYSDVFVALTDSQDDPNAGDRNIMADNVRLLWESYQPQEGRPDISSKLRKLYDHLSLDLARLNYTAATVDRTTQHEEQLAKIQGTLTAVKAEQNNLRDLADKVRKSVRKATQKIDRSQQEYIAILGIFSAVVLTFIGGMAFTTSVLQNIHQVSIYRLVLAICLIGLVLCNAFYLLFSSIRKLMIYTVEDGEIKQEDRSAKGFSGLKKRWSIIWWTNLVLIAMMALVTLAWFFGWVEKRDQRLESQQYSTVETQSTTSSSAE